MNVRIAALLLAALAAAVGCRRPGRAGVATDSAVVERLVPPLLQSGFGEETMAMASVEGGVPSSVPAQRDDGGTGAILEAMDAARRLIRNGEVSVEVADFDRAARRAVEIARSFEGYVADSRTMGEASRRVGVLTVRVRAEHFERALQALESLGKVRSEHVGTQDVTKAYTDLEGRLRVKREAAERVREILRNRTARLADVLEAERQLSNLVEQIEVMEGERRYYDQQVALSTISAELHEPESVARASALAPLRRALHDSVRILSTSLAAFVVGLLYVVPWALLLMLLWSLRRRLRRRQARAA